MALPTFEMEGTWEEILERGPELAGRRVRVSVLPGETDSSPQEHADEAVAASALSQTNRQMLEAYRSWMQVPLTEDEEAILDEFHQFRKEHPLTFRTIDD